MLKWLFSLFVIFAGSVYFWSARGIAFDSRENIPSKVTQDEVIILDIKGLTNTITKGELKNPFSAEHESVSDLVELIQAMKTNELNQHLAKLDPNNAKTIGDGLDNNSAYMNILANLSTYQIQLPNAPADKSNSQNKLRYVGVIEQDNGTARAIIERGKEQYLVAVGDLLDNTQKSDSAISYEIIAIDRYSVRLRSPAGEAVLHKERL